MAEKKQHLSAHSAEIIEKLLNKAKKRGAVLTYTEIVDAFQSEELSPEEIDDMYESA